MYHNIGHLYDDFIREEQGYYLPREEGVVIRKFVNNYSFGTIDNMIELGAGTESSLADKTIPLLNCFRSQRYKAVDLNHQYCEEIAKFIKRRIENIDVSVIEADFIYGNFQVKQSRSVYALLGGTIGNLSALEREVLLSKIYSYLKTGDYCLLVWDSCNDESMLKNAYYNEYTKKFVLSIFQYYAQKYDHNEFDESDLKVVYKFDREASCVKLGLMCKKDVVFYEGGAEALFKADKAYYSVYSYKYSIDGMKEILSKLGFYIAQHEISDNGFINIALLSKK